MPTTLSSRSSTKQSNAHRIRIEAIGLPWRPPRPLNGRQAIRSSSVVNKIRGRPDSPEVADLLEVYCLCLLLGYEGPNSGARTPAGDLLVRIHRIRGAGQDRLFPGGLKPTVQPAMERAGLPPPLQSGIWTWLASICLILACLSWAVLSLLQRAEARAIVREVTSR